MAKKVIHYSEIKWETIDYTIVTKVVDICRTIKEHYWNNRPCGSYRSEIIANGLDYDFLIKAFSTYHEDWYERTSNSSKIVNLFILYLTGKYLQIVPLVIILQKQED